MTKSYLAEKEKGLGETAVDGLLAGLVGGAAMALFLVVIGWLTGAPPLTTLAYFDPAQTGSWLTGLLAHLAVSAIYGVVFGLLLGIVGRIRPSLAKRTWLWGMGYGLLLWVMGLGVALTAVGAPLAQIPAWEFAMAHLLYGLAAGYRLQTSY
ncbi:MAG: hypothetical protein R6X34_01625 [Chloroflexota bacterium]